MTEKRNGDGEKNISPLDHLSSLNETLSRLSRGEDKAQIIANKNLSDFRQNLEQEINVAFDRIENTSQLLSNLDSPIFAELLMEIYPKAAWTRSETKRQYYRKILINALQGYPQPDFSVFYLSVLHTMTDLEVSIFGSLVKLYYKAISLRNQGNKVDFGPFDQDTIFGLERDTFKIIIQGLIAKGLAFDDSHSRWDSVPYTFVEPTELGIGFHEYVLSAQKDK